MITMLRGIQRVAQDGYAKIQPTLSSIQEKVNKVWNQVKTSTNNGISCVKNQASKLFTRLSDVGSCLSKRITNAYHRAFKPASQSSPVNG